MFFACFNDSLSIVYCVATKLYTSHKLVAYVSIFFLNEAQALLTEAELECSSYSPFLPTISKSEP